MDPDVTFLSNGPVPVVRVLFITLTGYLTLVVLLRVTGRRTLSQMSALDFVITVTLGSAFGRVITARDVALFEVVAAFAGLILLQWLVGRVWGGTTRLRRLVDVPPALLYYDGEVIRSAMRRNHLRDVDLHSAVRAQGMGSLEDVRAIVMEGNGGFTVVSASQFGDGAAVRSLVPDEPEP